MKFDLLIIYNDRTEKTIKEVENYGVKTECKCFYFEKKGCIGFMPIDNILYIGRKSDYVG